MQLKNNFNKSTRLYIIFFSTFLFINIFITIPLNANTYKIKDLEISEPFKLNFNKKKVIDKAFKEAFLELISMTTSSDSKSKINKTSLSTIKRLIDSFTISNERFINNVYFAKFDVNFSKKNTLIFFEKKNIFPSIPKKRNLLLIPVLVDTQKNQILLFNSNILYSKWNENNKRYNLLNYILPSEDLEDVNLINQNSNSIEDYNFKEIIDKYDISNFIITIVYKDNNNLRILSKIKLNESYKIVNQKFENKNLAEKNDLEFVLNNLKTTYENYWKKINQINTSIKTPLKIRLKSTNHNKIKNLENLLQELDLVSSYEITKLNNKNIFFKIIYNGTPRQFIDNLSQKNIKIINQNQDWIIE